VAQGRLDEWRVGLRALGDSPLVGYGPEGYRTVFGRHVDQQYVVDWGREVITDRAHGGLLDVGLALGLPGALIYLGLILLVLRGAVLAVANGEPIRAGLAVGVIGYLVQQQFLFPLSELDPVFWLAAGLVLAPSIRIATPAPTAFRSAMAGLAVGLAVVVAAAGALDLTADSLTTAAIEDGDQSAPTSLRPDSIRYRFIASRVAGQDGDRRRALQHIEDGLRRSPADPALRGEQARLLLDIARADDGPSRSTRLVVALAALEALVADDPLHPEHLQRLGVARALTEDYDGAIEALEQAMTLAPDRPDIVQNLAEVIRLRDDR
jgi:tetratricopeptide (TPR) repeat protein